MFISTCAFKSSLIYEASAGRSELFAIPTEGELYIYIYRIQLTVG